MCWPIQLTAAIGWHAQSTLPATYEAAWLGPYLNKVEVLEHEAEAEAGAPARGWLLDETFLASEKLLIGELVVLNPGFGNDIS